MKLRVECQIAASAEIIICCKPIGGSSVVWRARKIHIRLLMLPAG